MCKTLAVLPLSSITNAGCCCRFCFSSPLTKSAMAAHIPKLSIMCVLCCAYWSFSNYNCECRKMMTGVPQGSILGPIVSDIYLLPLDQIRKYRNLSYHAYTDDTQLYISVSKCDYSSLQSLNRRVQELNAWMCQNFPES